MTTLAVGLDIVTTTTFADQLADTASGFVDATFTAREQRDARAPETIRVQRLAARFAAKEAFVKAWSGARAGRPPPLATSTCARSRSSTTATAGPRCACTAPLPWRSTSWRPSSGSPRASGAPLAQPRPADGRRGRRAQRRLTAARPARGCAAAYPHVRFGASWRSRHSATATSATVSPPIAASGSTTSPTPPPSRITSR